MSQDIRAALENLLIAIGMGWDLDGVVDVAQSALAAPSEPDVLPGLKLALKLYEATTPAAAGRYIRAEIARREVNHE